MFIGRTAQPTCSRRCATCRDKSMAMMKSRMMETNRRMGSRPREPLINEPVGG